MSKVSIYKNTKETLPISQKALEEIKNKILGKEYELSIAFVGQTKIRRLNKQYRQKDKATDVLSFNVDKNLGELIICPIIAKKEAPIYRRTYKNFLYFLVIHGLHHLKGMEHSSKMEQEEEKIRKVYSPEKKT